MTNSSGNKLPNFESKKTKDKRVKLQSLPELDRLLNEFDKEESKNPEDIKKVEEAINKVIDEEELISSMKSNSKKSKSRKPMLPDFENIYDKDFNLAKEHSESKEVNHDNEPESTENYYEHPEVPNTTNPNDSNIIQLEEEYSNDKLSVVGKINTEDNSGLDIAKKENDDEALMLEDQPEKKDNTEAGEEEIYNHEMLDNEQEEIYNHEMLDNEQEELYNDEILDNEQEEVVEDLDDEEHSEDDQEFFEEDFSFLPTVNMDDEEDDDIVEEELFYDDKEYSNENTGEIDEEALKNFFANIKNKILGVFNKDAKKDIKQPELDMKDEEPKQKDKKLNIDKKYFLYPIIAVAIIGVMFFIVNMLGSSYNNIDEINFNAKNEEAEISVEFAEFSYDNSSELLSYTVYNKGEISADFFFELEMKEKKLIPFTGSTIGCESDIIALEPDGSSLESIKCDKLNKDSKYKASVEIIEVK